MSKGQKRQENSMKVLAIDDEEIALEALVDAIKTAAPAAEIHSFQKAEEALEFYRTTPCEVAFLDIQMWNMNGVDLAKRLKLLNANINIIFSTAYGDYREEAFDLHASGYLTKPITPSMIRRELDNLRHPVMPEQHMRVQIVAFGNFEVYVDGEPLEFRYDKTKELLAYLVDRNGAYCSNAEIMAALWEDEKKTSYLGNLKKDLLDTLREKKCQNIIEAGWGRIRIDTEKVDCDYYKWCEGELAGINSYRGEYMTQYSWAEFTNAGLR